MPHRYRLAAETIVLLEGARAWAREHDRESCGSAEVIVAIATSSIEVPAFPRTIERIRSSSAQIVAEWRRLTDADDQSPGEPRSARAAPELDEIIHNAHWLAAYMRSAAVEPHHVVLAILGTRSAARSRSAPG